MTTTDQPHTSDCAIRHNSSPDWCRVTLTANEVDERRLHVNDLGQTRVRSLDGIPLSEDKVKLLCGSGLAWARSNLRLAAGVVVTVVSIDGELDSENERGVCRAVALAIARNLKKDFDPEALITSEWEETSMD